MSNKARKERKRKGMKFTKVSPWMGIYTPYENRMTHRHTWKRVIKDAIRSESE